MITLPASVPFRRAFFRKAQIALGLRCCGDCCKRFPLSVSFEELEQIADNFEGRYPAYYSEQGRIIRDMVIPVDVGENGRQYYRCRHLLTNGDCGIYAERPTMCSQYPYGKECEHKGCRWRIYKIRWPFVQALAWVRALPWRLGWRKVCKASPLPESPEDRRLLDGSA
jgi:Fe-S-cluster containining protein